MENLHEGGYGAASLAFILTVMVMVVLPFALMALGLYLHFHITW